MSACEKAGAGAEDRACAARAAEALRVAASSESVLGYAGMEWEAGEVMQDREAMFVLYVVAEGLCTSMADFRRHFAAVDETGIEALLASGCLTESGGVYGVTERGRLVLGDLARGDGTGR